MSVSAPAVLLLAMLGFAVRTRERNRDWQNDLTLAESMVLASPRSFKAHMMLARALYGADPRHASIDRVIAEGERTVALLDPLPDTQNTWSTYRELAGYYLVKGEGTQRAIQLLNRAIAILEASPPTPSAEGDFVVPLDLAEAYRILSGAWLRVSDTKNAYEAAVRARDLNPASADAYRNVAEALHASGRDEEAITALMEGQMLTSDRSLSTDIVLLYRAQPHPGCTITEGPGGPQPDVTCPIVRTQICQAVGEAMRVQLRLHRQREATLMMMRSVQSYGCPLDPLEKILAQR